MRFIISYILATITNKKQLRKRRSITPQEGDTYSHTSSSATHSSVNDDRKLTKRLYTIIELNVVFDKELIILLFDLDKGKAGGKGAKTISPVLDGPNESDTSRPLDSEEIQALAIRIDELEKVVQHLKEAIVILFSF